MRCARQGHCQTYAACNIHEQYSIGSIVMLWHNSVLTLPTGQDQGQGGWGVHGRGSRRCQLVAHDTHCPQGNIKGRGVGARTAGAVGDVDSRACAPLRVAAISTSLISWSRTTHTAPGHRSGKAQGQDQGQRGWGAHGRGSRRCRSARLRAATNGSDLDRARQLVAYDGVRLDAVDEDGNGDDALVLELRNELCDVGLASDDVLSVE